MFFIDLTDSPPSLPCKRERHNNIDDEKVDNDYSFSPSKKLCASSPKDVCFELSNDDDELSNDVLSDKILLHSKLKPSPLASSMKPSPLALPSLKPPPDLFQFPSTATCFTDTTGEMYIPNLPMTMFHMDYYKLQNGLLEEAVASLAVSFYKEFQNKGFVFEHTGLFLHVLTPPTLSTAHWIGYVILDANQQIKKGCASNGVLQQQCSIENGIMDTTKDDHMLQVYSLVL